MKAVLPEALQNIVAPYMYKPSDEEEEEEYFGVDYARLASVVLWGVVKNQQTQINDLTTRIAALEQQITKSKPKASKKMLDK